MPETFLLRDLPRYECLEKRSRRYPDLEIGAVEATLSLMYVASDLMDAFAVHFARNGTSQGRFLVMMILDRYTEQELLPSELAEKIGVTRATVTGLLDGLEKEGFVQRRQHKDDRRALTVHLTEAGHAFLEAMLPGHYRRIAALMRALDGEERRELIRLLNKVSANTGALRDDNGESLLPARKLETSKA